MNVLHPCDGGRLSLALYLATVVCPMSMPSLSSSPWIRGAPQSGLARLTSRMSRRISSGVCGRPLRGPDLLRQYAPKPARCQPITGLRLDDLQSIEHSRGQMIEHGKHQAVNVSKGHSVGRFSSQNIELVSKQEDFGLQRSS